MALAFVKATKEQLKARVALLGPAGSGKTYSALSVASCLGKRIAVIDTERGSARKYAHRFAFDVLELESFSPDVYVDAIHAAEQQGYDVIVIDSLSHAWIGKDGALEQVDRVKKRGGNAFNAWGDVTPKHTRMIDAMLGCKAHLVVTMRVKMEYVQEKDERTNKTTIRKIGLQPTQRDGLEYEFDVVGELTTEHLFVISKTRCDLLDGKEFDRPGANLATPLLAWLSDGAAKEPAPAETAKPAEVSSVTQAAIDAIGRAETSEQLDALAEELRVARDLAGRGSADDARILAAYRERKAALGAAA